MLKNDEILEQFNSRMNDFFMITRDARDEASDLYRIRDSHRVQTSGLYRDLENVIDEKIDDRSSAVINIAAAYMRAAVGQQVSNAKDVECVASNPLFDKESDIANDCLEYVARVGQLDYSRTLAFEDTYTRGWGCTVLLNNTNVRPLSGEPYIARKFFAAYDTSVRSGDLNRDSAWSSYGDPINIRDMDKYIKRMGGDNTQAAVDVHATEYMQYAMNNDFHLLDFLHHYYWRDYVPAYDVENPYVAYQEDMIAAAQIDPQIAHLYKIMREKLNVSKSVAFWTLDSDGMKELEAFIDIVRRRTGVSLDAINQSKRDVLMYYQAQIARGMVLKKEQSYCQNGHALNFITSFYDETLGYYYGIMRPLAQVQQLLNEAVESYHNYVKSAEVGGTIGINKLIDSGAGQLIDDLRRKRKIISVPDGADVSSLGLPDTAQALRGLVDFYVSIMPNTAGLPPEILGMLSTKDMGEGLMNAITEQMNISLLHTSNGINSYMRHHGKLGIDLMRKMAAVGDREHLVAITGHGNESIIEFSEQNFASDYAFVLRDKPSREDARRRDAKLLIEALGMLQPEQQATILPVILDKLPIDYQDREAIKEMLEPKPPSPEEQEAAAQQQAMQMAQMEANIRMINAQAAQLEQQSGREQTQAELNQQKSLVEIDKAVSDIGHKQAQTVKTEADTAKVIADIGMQAYQQVNNINQEALL